MDGKIWRKDIKTVDAIRLSPTKHEYALKTLQNHTRYNNFILVKMICYSISPGSSYPICENISLIF